MCSRVRLSSDVSEIKLVFSIPPHRPAPNTAPSWNVAPTDLLPIVRYDAKAGERSLDVLRWGLVPFWAKDIKVGFSNINAVCVIVRRRHPAGPAVPSAVPYEVGRIGNEPSKSPRTMYPAVTTGTETARGRYFCQHQGG
jgi:hypothetical protein